MFCSNYTWILFELLTSNSDASYISLSAYRTCLSEDHRCSSGLCIPPTKKCDGYFDCRDESDETGCNMTSCTKDKFRCVEKCIEKSQKCDHKKDCDDNSDEEGCGKFHISVTVSTSNDK